MQQKPLKNKYIKNLKQLTIKNEYRLTQQLHHINKITNTQDKAQQLALLDEKIEFARLAIENKRGYQPVITYPQALPVSEEHAQIYDTILAHQVVILAGETGSGKTTQLPKICLEMGRGIRGLIGHTQPRRIAARSVATRIAEELGTSLGDLIGYKVRFSDQINKNTRVKLMTDGILLAEIQHDRLLLQYDTLIIDEAHERSLNIDFILGYIKKILPQRPDLKIIITSATIDLERFSCYFSNAPIIEVSGRTFPVETRYRPLSDDNEGDQLSAIINAIDELSQDSPGDILLFLTGEKEIRDTAKELDKLNLPHTQIIPLFARLSITEQQRIFKPHVGRHIILATNIAETSLTVPGIKYVIDPGMARISRYSYRTKVQRLPIEPISQASANQRKGRCGRVSAGICIRLYDEQDFLSRPEFTLPEIKRTNLAAIILQMAALDLGDIHAFPFIESPDKRHIQDGIQLLTELGCLQNQAEINQPIKLTTIGHQLARLPLDPRLSRMLIEARKLGSVKEIMIITAALSIQDPRERPMTKREAADEKHRRFNDKQSDFLAFLNLWAYIQEAQQNNTTSQFRTLCKNEYLNYLRIKEWQDIYQQLQLSIKELQIPINSKAADYRAIHCALLSGLLTQIGMKQLDCHEFLGARNVKFSLYPQSALFKKPPKWCVVAELVETTRIWGRIAAAIDPLWIEQLAPHLVKYSYSEPHWSKSQGAAMANEKVTLFGLPLIAARKINYGRIDSVVSRELFIRHALVEGNWQTTQAFFHYNQQLRGEVSELEDKSRRRDIVVSDNQLFDFYDNLIDQSVISSRHFDTWWNKIVKTDPTRLNFDKQMLLNEDEATITDIDYPPTWHQGNIVLPLTYKFEPGGECDGVTINISLSILNQINEEGFEWQIPAFRLPLIIALIKSLPKSLRRSLVPAPNYAQTLLDRLTPLQGSLLTVMSNECRKMTGVTIHKEDWSWSQVPDYLKMTFCIDDDKGEAIISGKSLQYIKQQLKEVMSQTLSSIAENHVEQQGLTLWEFDALPQEYIKHDGNYNIVAYPSLIDDGDSVSIKLLDNKYAQAIEMKKGLRRLLLLTIPSPIKYLHEKLPNKVKLSLYFASFGTVLSLIDDIIACSVDKLVEGAGGVVWEKTAFAGRAVFVRTHINQLALTIAQQVEEILNLTYGLQKRLKGTINLTLALPLSEIKAQLSSLVYPGFLTVSGKDRLADIVRYLHAIDKRLDKLPSDVNRDHANMLKVQVLEKRYQQLVTRYQLDPEMSEKVRAIFWMLQELRVSFFAQQLGTAHVVSEKRILQYMDEIAKG